MLDNVLTIPQHSRFDTDDSERTVISINNLNKEYETGAGVFSALSDVNVSISAGELVAIVGKSGSGKSTLLNLVTGIDRATSGEVNVAGAILDDLSENELARWRGANVGLVFQFQQLMPTLTILENVVMAMDFAGVINKRERNARALELLDLVGVANQAEKFPSALSGGQQQRAAIARALANDPPLIAADEPTGSLDSQTADMILQLFRDLTEAGKTVVIVTHERDVERFADRVITVSDGRIVGSDV